MTGAEGIVEEEEEEVVGASVEEVDAVGPNAIESAAEGALSYPLRQKKKG